MQPSRQLTRQALFSDATEIPSPRDADRRLCTPNGDRLATSGAAGDVMRMEQHTTPTLHGNNEQYTTPMLHGNRASLLQRQAMSASAARVAMAAGTPCTPGKASIMAQAAFKEILASPSPKVSSLVERIRVKEAENVERAVAEQELEKKRTAMLAEAQKVREIRKKAADESKAAFRLAERLRAEADQELAEQRKWDQASIHRAKRNGALFAAEEKCKQRAQEAELARAAMDSALAEHEKAVRVEQSFLDGDSEYECGPALGTPQSDGDFSSPMSGLQVLSKPPSAASQQGSQEVSARVSKRSTGSSP